MTEFLQALARALSQAWNQFACTPLCEYVAQSAPLRELTVESVALRLFLAMLLGGLIGMQRQRMHRPAGFRTYMMVCMGAALTIILGQYELQMVQTTWLDYATRIGAKVDVTRFGAQVINGVGFLGAGTILVTQKHQVKGLTTAAGLWASACMGLAVGAGFYEGVLLAFVLILNTVVLLPRIESNVVERSRNMNIYMEFRSLDAVNDVITLLKSMNTQICDVEIDRGKATVSDRPYAIFTIRLLGKQSHASIIAELSAVETISFIEEM